MIPGVPEEIPGWIRSTRDARHWLACAFRAQGYTVVEDPGPDDLPDALWDYHMDLLAQKGEQRVAAVVRRRNDISDNNIALAALLKTLPGWRFDMIVLPISVLRTPHQNGS
ncbi:hypothetical protein [Armatimonas sp.]|uniref:hypothetical protein n=1 Tax=Armatimonas sp. TaxID=1872638 RepID=UPI0037525079